MKTEYIEGTKFIESLIKGGGLNVNKPKDKPCIKPVGTSEKELVQAQNDYIKFLGAEINKSAGYMAVHNMQSSKETIAEGERLRAIIKHFTPEERE